MASMAAQTFDTVWYLPHENKWHDLNVLAYRDVGRLTVSDNLIEFKGKNETLSIYNVLRVSCGKQGRDFVNNWVKVEYGGSATPSVAYFADGSLHGWGGIFGGTKRILQAVKQVKREDVAILDPRMLQLIEDAYMRRLQNNRPPIDESMRNEILKFMPYPSPRLVERVLAERAHLPEEERMQQAAEFIVENCYHH